MVGAPLDSLAFRTALVEVLRRDDHLHSPRVEAALLAVPREAFVPGVPLAEVYSPSDAIVTKRVGGVSVSSASAPEVIALMLEQLDPRPGDHVLEIGAGTGYNAALLAHMVGASGHVASLDIDEDLVLSAREHLAAAGYGEVEIIQSDGALGYPAAPTDDGLSSGRGAFDRIILTVASSDIAPAWRDQLTRPDGRLVMPLALRGLQRCVAFVRDPEDPDCLVGESLRNCSFIALRGVLGSGGPRLPIDADGGLLLGTDDETLPLQPERIGELLARPLRSWPSGVSARLDDVRWGLHLWLVARQPNIYTLWTGMPTPDLFGLTERAGARGTLCLIDRVRASLALLAWADASASEGELCVVAPLGGEAVAEQLQKLLAEWQAAGRPDDAWTEIRAYPRARGPEIGPGEVVIDRRWTRFVLSWRQPPAIFTV